MELLLEKIDAFIGQPWARPLIAAVLSVFAAYFVERVAGRLLTAATRRTKTNLDDRIVAVLRRPVFLSVLLFGFSIVLRELHLSPGPTVFTISSLKTIAVLVWAGAMFRVSHEILQVLSEQGEDAGLLQKRTIPIFDIVVKAAVIGGAVYFFFLAWHIDVTAWLASAGIVGIAVGFAAKDTLANLFSGLFIIADAPYKVGDYIVLEGDLNGQPLRGEVTRIGMRSSRIVTRDDLEITVPNAVIGNSKIVNETGGPTIKQRVHVPVGVAYGSDVDKVAEVLLGCADGIPCVCDTPIPEIRFRGFGDSSLNFELLFWTDRPRMRGLTESRINFRIYKALQENGITIPFPQRDLWIKEAPAGRRLSAD